MSFLSRGSEVELVLLSPIEGQLTYKGQPAPHADINVWVAWKDQEGENFQYKSNKDGYFSIPKKTVVIKDSPLSELSVGQMITVRFNGNDTLIWKAGKSSSHLYGELGGEPVGLTCELTREDMDDHLAHALVETKCMWKEFKSIKED